MIFEAMTTLSIVLLMWRVAGLTVRIEELEKQQRANAQIDGATRS